MHYLFELQHPKHYHQFKNIISMLKSRDDEILIVARDKDVLLSLLQYDNQKYRVMGKYGKGIFKKFLLIPGLIFEYLKIIIHFKPDIILSKASPYAAVIGKFMKIFTVITPDSEIVSLTNKFTAPLSNLIITQNTFKKNLGKKHRKISSFFEVTYLHPNYFTADFSEIQNFVNTNSRFFVLRFIGWSANHDINQFGFSDAEKIKLVNHLSKFGKVIITSEKSLPEELRDYVMKIHPAKIHHLLALANLYVGDSQSMATESCLLGTPSIRYNSFVGNNDMSNFRILGKKYKLLYNCSNFAEVMNKVNKIIEDKYSKKKRKQKAKQYFSDIEYTNIKILKI